MKIFLSFLILLNMSFAQENGTVKWKFKATYRINSVVLNNEAISYINAYNILYAIDQDGNELWQKQYEAEISDPVLDSSGNIYFTGGNGYLTVLDPQGNEKWTYELSPFFHTSVAIAQDGTIYIPYNGLIALTSGGSKKWTLKFPFLFSIQYPPTIGMDGTIYVNSALIISAVDPSGKIKWVFETDDQVRNSPAHSDDGTIYFGSIDGNLYALNPDGTVKWKYQTSSSLSSSVSIGYNGTIYAGAQDGSFFAINPDGTEKWKIQLDNLINDAATIGQDSTIYIGTRDSTLYAFYPDAKEKWHFKVSKPIIHSPLIKDNVLYATSEDAYLYALHGSNYDLAFTPWPKLQKDNRASGNGYNPDSPVAQVAETYISAANGDTTITLDGSLSYKPSGEIDKYTWRIVEKPENSQITLNDSTSPIIDLDIPLNEHYTYRFALTVSGSPFGSSSTSVFVESGIKWELSGEFYNQTSVIANNTVYIASKDSVLHALNNDGSNQWTYKLNGQAYSSPVITSDGTILIGLVTGILYAINQNGSGKWQKHVTEGYVYTPAIGPDSTIYVASNLNGLYALRPNGDVKWSFTETDLASSPAVGFNNTIYIFSADKELLAISAEGIKKWAVPIPGIRVESLENMAINNTNGVIYVSRGLDLYAISPNGRIKWVYNQDGSFGSSSVSVGMDDMLYFLSDKLYAIYPDGQLQWEFPYTGYSGGAPAIGADGTIYFGTSDLHVYAVNPDGSARWKYKDYQTYYSSATIGQDGTVFISNETKFRAFYSLCGGLANAPWPEYRYDGQNTAYGTVDSIPHLYIIDDHPNDQGGWLDVQFTHSNYDNDPETTAEYYIVQKNEGNQWKAIDTVLAAGEKLYSLIVSTAKDSNALSRNDVQLQVTAFLNEGIFESKIDSGYSVDNIAPFKPVGFSAALNDSATILSWQANTESDINFYSVYRVFGREQLELLDMTSDTFYVDKNIDYGETYSYTISATDSAGNESDFSSYVQIKVTSLNQVNNFPARNYLYQNYPNPFNPNTKINYELKHPANVEIIIFDLSGRIIKKIVKKDQPAGYHFLDFDGSHLASGIYFYQLKTKYYIKSRKMLLLK